jgi:hypothetical protein
MCRKSNSFLDNCIKVVKKRNKETLLFDKIEYLVLVRSIKSKFTANSLFYERQHNRNMAGFKARAISCHFNPQ